MESEGASKSFIRDVFFSQVIRIMGLIQYLGESTASKIFAHRNIKTAKTTILVQRKPSKVKVWQQKVETEDAHVLYKKKWTDKMKMRKMRSKKRFFENHETWNNYGISKKVNRQQPLTWNEL